MSEISILGVSAFYRGDDRAVANPPRSRRMTFACALAWVNARIILTVVFYLVLTPVGLVRRFLGYDPMSRRLDRDAVTYRVTRELRPGSHVEKQY